MNKLIGIDLDGTLLGEDKKISEFTKQTLSEVIKYNHQVVIVTGRSYFGAKKYHNELKLKTPLISLNGALISLPDGSEIKKSLPKKLVMDVYNDLNKYFLTALFNCSNKMYTINHNADLEYLFNGALITESYIFDKNKIAKEDILNIVVLISEEHKESFESYFEKLPINCRYWGSHEGQLFYDIHLRNVSKATALREVLRLYNLSKKDLVAFGDGPNDLEMLQYANDGIAMKNASKEIKEQVKEITDHDNDNDGVARYLIKYYI